MLTGPDSGDSKLCVQHVGVLRLLDEFLAVRFDGLESFEESLLVSLFPSVYDREEPLDFVPTSTVALATRYSR